MTSMDFDPVIDTLTAEQWLDIIRAKEDSLLPVCCGNVSDLRDSVMTFLRMPTVVSAAYLMDSLLGHEIPKELQDFRDALFKFLEANSTNWQKFMRSD